MDFGKRKVEYRNITLIGRLSVELGILFARGETIKLTGRNRADELLNEARRIGGIGDARNAEFRLALACYDKAQIDAERGGIRRAA